MALFLHRAERTDLLADGLGDLLSIPLADPFDQEVVVVPARGVERWLTQRLSHRLGAGARGADGVCAGVRFISPHSLVAMLLGREHDDPWEPDRLVWPLLEVIDESLADPGFAVLAAHLGEGVDGDEGRLRRNRRYSVARRVAGLFASYALQRPQLVTDWRQGRDTDGIGGDLDEDLRWQAELWRRLLDRVAGPPPDVRHAETVARLEAGDASLDLPARLSMFGHTRLPLSEVRLLGALGSQRDVHLWLPQASPALWDDLATLAAEGPVPRAEDASAAIVGHPLLASLGRDARELQRTLAVVLDKPDGGLAVDSAAPAPSTLLGWLQADLRANHAPVEAVRALRVPAADDRSVQVHACHGPARQVDVLREVLVGLLEDDPTLEPRDILVMCPDIETYAPLISAGFGLGDLGATLADRDAGRDGHPAHRLRVRLADRALSSTNPLLSLAARLVELAGGRVTSSEVLDLAGSDPVRRRFRFSDDDLARVTTWIGEAAVRWGLDTEQRAAFAMDRFAQNTWRAGLDRILLGVAMSGDGHRHLAQALPVDDVGSNDIDLAGQLAEFADRLGACLRALSRAESVTEWMLALEQGVRSLGELPPTEAWQVTQFERELARAVAAATDGTTSGTTLRLADVRALLASRLRGRPTRANFRTGTLTVCTMVPMRSVPHRVVCLVGLDDGVFPRVDSIDGDDVLARRPLTGERDLRSEDRQLLLDAVLAARETLVVTYTGANEHSGARRPPAVPLGELLDALDHTAAEPVRERVLVRHPLQPDDPRNVTPGELGVPTPFSFDAAALAGAAAAAGVRQPPPPFLDGPLAPARRDDVTLADLKRFFAHPVRDFLRQRLDVSTPLEAEEVHDAIPIDLDALEKWGIGDRLLRDVMAGLPPEAVLTAEQLRGTLPPGALGTRSLHQVAVEAQRLYDATARLRAGAPRTLDVDIDLGDGRRLTGTVPGLYGHRIASLGYSSLKARQRLMSWLDLLALSVGHPDENWVAHAVGKAKAGPTCAQAGPLDHRAREWLLRLVQVYDAGMAAPVPLPIRTGCAWAEAHARALTGADISPAEAARREWETDRYHPLGIQGEDADPAHVRVYGEAAPVRALLEAGMAEHAWAVWEPLVTGAERVGPL